ncbi:MAG: hypothetical protein V1752_06980 [Candidatus Firestonebacteria bacterium]
MKKISKAEKAQGAKITRKELLEKILRYSFAGVLASLAGFLTIKSIFGGKSCRDYDRCLSCKDKSSCSLVSEKQIKIKWKGK